MKMIRRTLVFKAILFIPFSLTDSKGNDILWSIILYFSKEFANSFQEQECSPDVCIILKIATIISIYTYNNINKYK